MQDDLQNKRIFRIFVCALALATMVTTYFACHLELTDQEAYYWTWSRAIDLSYFDHPPLQAWTTALLTQIFGQQVWVVRLPSLFGHLAAMAIFYNYARRRYDGDVALLALLAILSTPFFTLGSVVALPDALAIPLALATLLYSDRKKHFAASVCFGFALLAKWTSIFFLPGYLIGLWQARNWRTRFYSMIPLALQTPVIIWNIKHNAASLIFHLSARHDHRLLSLAKYVEHAGKYLGLQLFAGGFVLLAFVIILIPRANRANFVSDGVGDKSNRRHLILWALPAFLIVGISAIQGEVRFYWTGIAFFPLFAFVANQLKDGLRLRFARITSAVVALNLALISLAMLFPVGPEFEKIFHLKPDARHSPRGDIAGWSDWVRDAIAPAGLVNTHTAFIGSNFRIAAQVAWATQLNVYQTATAGSDKNEYQYWPYPNPPTFSESVFVTDNRYNDRSGYQRECGEPVDWKMYDVRLHGALIKEISWAVCHRPVSHPTITKG